MSATPEGSHAAHVTAGPVSDTESNLVTITDANNHATTFAYDAFGRVTQTTFPSNNFETYEYDADNNLTRKTDRKNQTIQYVYDALNRLTQKNYPDSTSAAYTYDLVGKVLQVNDPTGTYGFSYDNMGRLIGTSTQYSFLTGTFTNAYTYDAASNRIGYTAPDGSTNTYTYDTLNRLSTLANSWAGSFGFSYDALSRRTQMTRPNGVATNYTYDNLSHLLSVLHQLSGSTIDGATYTVDNAGNRLSKTDNRTGVTTNYTYDAIYELLQATQRGSTTESYNYDPVGNRLSSLGVAYTVNSSNELTSTPSTSYSYDNNGNLTSKTDSIGTTSYMWDFENRLTQVTLPSSGGTVSFKYDPFGRRIQKAFTQNSTTTTTNSVYDANDSVEEADQNGNMLARYARTMEIDEPLAMQRASAISYYEGDGLESITSLTGTSGSIVQSYSYDSFGVQTASSGSVQNPFRYTGRELDAETTAYFYRARYYSTNSGRFISEDPLAFNTGLNFYNYVNGNPVNLSDPKGLFGLLDPWRAWHHYCDGTHTPWTTPFASIDWDTSNIEARIRGMVGGACSERTIPVSMTVGIKANGLDFLVIGHHAVKVTGTIQVNCNCTWSFDGGMRSVLGYDIYEFPPTGSIDNWIGRNACRTQGRPFRIYLPGGRGHFSKRHNQWQSNLPLQFDWTFLA